MVPEVENLVAKCQGNEMGEVSAATSAGAVVNTGLNPGIYV